MPKTKKAKSNDIDERCWILRLPHDLLVELVHFLNIKAALSLRSCSHEFNNFISKEHRILHHKIEFISIFYSECALIEKEKDIGMYYFNSRLI